MSFSETNKQKPGRIKFMFLILLGVLYMLLGIFIYFSRNYLAERPWGEIIAALFILYGFWRTYRAVKLSQSN